MFWQYESGFVSQIENIINKEDVTLKELMDEEDILQECKSLNKKLIEFLTQQSVLEELVSLVVTEPSIDVNEKVRFKYANLACEILTSDVAAINDALVSNEDLLNKLYNFIENQNCLNPLLASFFSKTVGMLFSKRTEKMFEFLKTKDFINSLVKHIETSAIMDLLLKLYIHVDTNDSRTTVANWLHSNNLLGQLVDIFKTTNSQCHVNAAQLLCDLVKACREHQSLLQEKATPDVLLETLESNEFVTSLLTNIFTSQTESAFVNGIAVLQSLLEYKKHWLSVNIQQIPSQNNVQQPTEFEGIPQIIEMQQNLGPRPDGVNVDQMTALDIERLTKGVEKVQAALIPKLEDFNSLLTNPPQKSSIRTTIGVIEKPLGATRLEVIHLIAALLTSNNNKIFEKFSELKTLTTIIELFFEYPWNNFLHAHVEQIVVSILNSANSNIQDSTESSSKSIDLVIELLTSCKLIERILERCQTESCEITVNSKKCRPGYMGHLINIANSLVEKCDYQLMQTHLSNELLEQWKTFVNDILSEINNKQKPKFIQEAPSAVSTDETFRQDSAFQQAFIEYQMQQMTRTLCSQIGFSASDFTELNENLANQSDLNKTLNFNFENQLSDKNKTMVFERICQEKSKDSIESNSSDEDDVWEDRDITESSMSQQKKPISLFGIMENATLYGTDSFDLATEEARNVQMDIDNGEQWSSEIAHASASSASAPMDTSNPWDLDNKIPKPENTSFEADSWADFSSFAPPDLEANAACVTSVCSSSSDGHIEPCEIPESTTSDESLVTQIEPSANSNLFMPCDSMKFTSEYQDNVVSSSTADNLQNGPC